MIDAVELRALLALEDHGTIAAAAGALDYTPSAVSQQLKRLEAKVGVALTRPVGRNLTLTPAGRALAREGRLTLTRWEDLAQAARSVDSRPRGHVRVATFPTAARGLVIPAVAQLRDTAPGLSLSLVESDITPALDAVRAGRYDACVVHGWRGLATPVPDDLLSDLITTDRADVVLRRSHHLADVPSLAPAELLDQPWVTQPPGTVCHNWFLHMFAPVGRTPRSQWEAGEYATQLAMVEALDAVALIPRMGVHEAEALTRVAVHDPVPRRDIYLVARRAFHETPSHTALLDALIGAASRTGTDPATVA